MTNEQLLAATEAISAKLPSSLRMIASELAQVAIAAYEGAPSSKALTAQTMSSDHLLACIKECDSLFDDATDWGSWMVAAANERETCVNERRRRGYPIEHKHLARYAGGRTD